MVRPGQTHAQQAIARIAGPMPTGVTVYRINGTWTAQRSPAQEQLDQADVILLGGHRTEITQEIYDEITDAGINLTVVG